MAALTLGTPEEVGMDPRRIDALHQRAPEWIHPQRMRSAVLLAARRGKVVFHEAWGPLTWRQGSAPMQKDSIFRVASITKPMTSTAAMMLVEDGRLGLNRPIKEYLPEICGEGADAVEVQHLFTHTSGFEEEEADERFWALPSDPSLAARDLEYGLHPLVGRYLSCLWDLPCHGTPGSKMTYSDPNYNLLGEIVRRVSGMALQDFAKARIFDPLTMKDTCYFRDEAKLDRIVCRRKDLVLPDGVWGADGLNVTAMDLAAFGQMFLDKGKSGGRHLLSPAGVHEMTRNQIPGVGTEFLGYHEEASWGLGWAVQHDERWKWIGGTLPPKGTFYHMGAGGLCLWVDPINEIVGVYLSVCLEIDENMEHHWNLDLFQNMVTASVID